MQCGDGSAMLALPGMVKMAIPALVPDCRPYSRVYQRFDLSLFVETSWRERWLIVDANRGMDVGHPAPTAQIRAHTANAHGSSLG